ncbi:MAG: HAMP domain-containing histidine kinase [Rhodothermia bacterium]|nr:HAMP domain-containing histidine kinase [Rhodothermia bacterium]
MKTYSFSVKLRALLTVLALFISVASLYYTNRLANQLQEREVRNLTLGAEALAQTAQPYFNPHLEQLEALKTWVASQNELREEQKNAFTEALDWSMTMPPDEPLAYMRRVWEYSSKTVPAIVSDESMQFISHYANVKLDSSGLSTAQIQEKLRYEIKNLDGRFKPIEVNISVEGFGTLKQYIHYGESSVIGELRWFPYIQLAFVMLFFLVGYFGLSHLRRSEQSKMWVGMAKEAAHQLGTPTTSLMGWVELMKSGELSPETEQELAGELEKDIHRLERVANRFSKIGSSVQLTPANLAPVVIGVTDYMRRRIPQQGKRHIRLEVDVPDDLRAPLAPELFEWVLENLIKNAMDAMDKDKGFIRVVAKKQAKNILLEITDNGKGMDRRTQQRIFEPGFSTKKRGWGLGLSLARRIISENHRGKIWVQASKLGEGTTFRIQIPFSE